MNLEAQEPEQEVALDADLPEAEVTQEVDPAVVEQAQKYGWKSPDDWKGDPPEGGHLSPEEYLGRPHVQVRIQAEQIEALKSDLDGVKQSSQQQLESMRKMSEDAAERRREAHQAEIQRIEQEMRTAASEADTERYEALEKNRNEALEARDAVDAAPSQSVPEVAEWQSKNPWFKTDLYAQSEAVNVSERVMKLGGSVGDQLAAVDRHMRRHFPELFQEETKPQRTTKVDGGGLAAITGAKSDFDKLGPEEQAQAKADVAEGLYKDVDEWTKVYLS